MKDNKIYNYTSNFEKYSWIPTNTGNIIFDLLIEKSYLLKENLRCKRISVEKNPNYKIKIEKLYIDDFVLPTLQVHFDVEISIVKIDDVEAEGTITFYYSKTMFINSEINISSNFIVEKNGKLKLFNFKINKFENIEIDPKLVTIVFEKKIPLAFYISIKRCFHLDNHHDQKLDTLIGIYDAFDHQKIMNKLLENIKFFEIKIKETIFYNKEIEYKEIYNIKPKVTGYISYLEAFKEIFNVSDDRVIKNSKYLLSSIEAMIQRQMNKIDSIKYIMTTILSFLMILLSFNIAYNSFFDSSKMSNLIFMLNDNLSSTIFFIQKELKVNINSRDVILIFSFLITFIFLSKINKYITGKSYLEKFALTILPKRIIEIFRFSLKSKIFRSIVYVIFIILSFIVLFFSYLIIKI